MVFRSPEIRYSEGKSGFFFLACNYIVNHMAVYVGESPLNAIVIERETFMMQAKHMQDGGMEIINGGNILNRPIAKFIGCTILKRRLYSSAHHPGSKA